MSRCDHLDAARTYARISRSYARQAFWALVRAVVG
jgi:hypothetical protein